MGLAGWLDVLQQIVMCGLQCAHHTAANGGNFEPNPTTSARLGSPSPHEDENAMADARSQTTIDDERVRVTTWSFEKAGDSTGAHVHEYDYVLVPVTGGTLTPCRRLTVRHARSPRSRVRPTPVRPVSPT